MKKIKKMFSRLIYRISLFIVKVKVDVYPKSPHFSANTDVHLIWFKKLRVSVASFKTPMNNGDVNIDYILGVTPVHILDVHYPNDWWDQLDEYYGYKMKNKQ